jgi:hypothetical protein
MADHAANQLLATIPEDARSHCWWLVRPGGTPIPGDRGGGVALLVEMRLTRRIGRALEVLRASPLLDAGDRLLAGRRARLGRFVPDGPAPRRYP